MQEKQMKGSSNERLEYLGDAVVQLAISEYVYKRIANDSDLYRWSDLIQYLVSNKHIHQVAHKMDLDQYLLYSKIRQQIVKAKILSDAFEALVGAILLDQGYDSASQFVTKHLIPDDFEQLLQKYVNTDHAAADYSYQINATELVYQFKNRSLLDTVFTLQSDHVVKYVGISVLRFIAVEHVFSCFPQAKEGQMSLSVHAIINHEDVCVRNAIRDLKLESIKDSNQDVIVCFHSLIGAIYIDSNFTFNTFRVESDSVVRHDLADRLIHRFLLNTFDNTPSLSPLNIEKPLKTILQHLCQVIYGIIPVYDQIQDENNGWRVAVRVGDQIIAEAIGSDHVKRVTDEAVRTAITICEEKRSHK
jgi:dsRNA-specific ribonuclease